MLQIPGQQERVIYQGGPSSILMLSSFVRTALMITTAAFGAFFLARYRNHDLAESIDRRFSVATDAVLGFMQQHQIIVSTPDAETSGVILLIASFVVWLAAYLFLRCLAKRQWSRRLFPRLALMFLLCMAIASVIAPSTTLAGFAGGEFQRVGGEVTQFVKNSTGLPASTIAFGLLVGLALLFSFAWFLGDLAKWQHERFLITSMRVEMESGFIKKNITSYELWHVVKVEYRRKGILQWLFGAGTIDIRIIEPRKEEKTKSLGPIPHARRVYDELKEARTEAGRGEGDQV